MLKNTLSQFILTCFFDNSDNSFNLAQLNYMVCDLYSLISFVWW